MDAGMLSETQTSETTNGMLAILYFFKFNTTYAIQMTSISKPFQRKVEFKILHEFQNCNKSSFCFSAKCFNNKTI